MQSTITTAHGSGGTATSRLIADVFMRYFHNEINAKMADAAILNIEGKLAFTTDSFVVKPLFFPGGDIGRLSICGTVNDLLTAGAAPRYISAGFILEEGLPLDTLHRVCRSMSETAKEANISIVTGDTKVIEGNGGMYINTSGIGTLQNAAISFDTAQQGDAIIVTGNLGDHHACILSQRLSLNNTIQSDAAPLNGILEALTSNQLNLHGIRDITRGGLATVLNEIAEATGLSPVIEEIKVPVAEDVAALCKILGLDPLYMGNEGKLVLLVPQEQAAMAVAAIKKAPYGKNAAVIGTLEAQAGVRVRTRLGGVRMLAALQGEGLPRIC
ncbi:MAG: hydrogenase expression/formation protein HypE [Oscillospiraceae bacterium]|jgi:hydrogenase expression/formation protein HypE|nr:hydrogenase expression/formation protein HypE [Oscillospiraceae bacterium]